MYAKAAVTGPLHRGTELPDSRYTLADQSIDPKHLADYQRVCGFRTTDVLPPTYLHVLAFPVTVALMTERAFPFPLVGLVHVANSITVARPVRADEQVSFEVRAADLRPHPAGRQLDLLVERRSTARRSGAAAPPICDAAAAAARRGRARTPNRTVQRRSSRFLMTSDVATERCQATATRFICTR